MKDIIANIFGFLYTLSMGDYIFFFGTFILLLSFVYILFLIKRDDCMETYYKSEDYDLEKIKDTIEKEYKPTAVKLTDYEEEQEKNAIISYEELIKNKDNYNVSYDENYSSNNDEINIKKISLDNNGVKDLSAPKLNVKLMNYDKEEAFLVALKQLQKNLMN